MKELIKKYEKQLDIWKIKREQLFKDKKYKSESILQSNSLLLYKIIKDMKAATKFRLIVGGLIIGFVLFLVFVGILMKLIFG